jgi:type VI secretion system secreted protein VgrG
MINGGGSYVKITAEGIEYGTQGHWEVHASSHTHAGPRNMTVPTGSLRNLYSARFHLSDQKTGQPLVQHAYRIKQASGRIISGFTDGEGWTLTAISPVSEAVELEVTEKTPVQTKTLYLAGSGSYELELEFLNEQKPE